MSDYFGFLAIQTGLGPVFYISKHVESNERIANQLGGCSASRI